MLIFEEKKMMKPSFCSIEKVLLCGLLVVSLFAVSSCKKTTPHPTTPSGDRTPPPTTKGDANEAKTAAANLPEPPTPTPSEPPKSTSSDANTAQLVPIELKLPKPMFVGTPQNTLVPNLEKPLGKSRPPFLAPAGTKNVALGKPVSSSDEEPIIGEIEMITDDDKEAADGSYVELGPALQYVTIDLGAVYEIYAVIVWHYHKQPCVYYDVVVQVADDKDFINNVRPLFNNDTDNTAGLGIGKDLHYTETNEGKLIDAKGVRGRYVRFYSKGNTNNDLNHYIEAAVYGKAAQ